MRSRAAGWGTASHSRPVNLLEMAEMQAARLVQWPSAMAKLALPQGDLDPSVSNGDAELAAHSDVHGVERAAKKVAKKPAAKASRAKPAPVGASSRARPTRSRPRSRDASASEAPQLVAKPSLQEPPVSQMRTFAIGAGIGAAVTLSVVAMRSKGRHSNLMPILLRTVLYAVGKTSTPGTLTNVLARAVGSALE